MCHMCDISQCMIDILVYFLVRNAKEIENRDNYILLSYKTGDTHKDRS